MPPVALVAQPDRAKSDLLAYRDATAMWPAWMTPLQAAAYTGLNVSTIYLALQSGKLSGVKTGTGRIKSHWRCRPSDVDKWLEAGRVRSR